MECRQTQFHLIAYLDGDLTASSADRMDRHFACCRRCREAREELRAVDTTLRNALRFPGVPYAYRQIAARMPDVTPLDEVAAFLPQLRVSGRAPRLAVAALMILLMLAGQFTLRQGRESVSAAKDVAHGHDQRIKAAYLEYLDTDLLKPENNSGSLST